MYVVLSTIILINLKFAQNFVLRYPCLLDFTIYSRMFWKNELEIYLWANIDISFEHFWILDAISELNV